MKGSNKIYHRPYLPVNRRRELVKPFICRLAPSENGLEFEWFDKNCDGKHTLYYGLRGGEEKTAVEITDSVVTIDGLESMVDYEFYIEAENGNKSYTRLFRPGPVPEGATVINYLHSEDNCYDFSGHFIASPSLARTKSGRLIAGMDLFGGGMSQNLELLYYSEDDGKTWRYLTDLYPFYWASLFVHKDVLYILGLTTEYGNLQLSCSYDEGETWEVPVTLSYGSNRDCDYGGMHRAPMQVVNYNGRLYTTCEYGKWGECCHLPMVASIDENDDLMNPENWSFTDLLYFEGEWKEKSEGVQCDTIEGNVVMGPDGNLYSFMRWKLGYMLQLKIDKDNPEAPLEFVDIVEAPVTNSMFKIIPEGNKYYMITNRKTEACAKYDVFRFRNVLSLVETEDFKNFRVIKDIFNRENEDPLKNGFQYPAVLYENGEFLMNVRTATNNPDNEHDSNYMLFCKA